QLPARDLDPLHAGRVPHRAGTLGDLLRREHQRLRLLAVVALPVVVALAIGAAPQPRLREQLLLDLAALPQLDLRLEDVDLAAPGFRDPGAEGLLPGPAFAHCFTRGAVCRRNSKRSLSFIQDSAPVARLLTGFSRLSKPARRAGLRDPLAPELFDQRGAVEAQQLGGPV